jgi:hypothetical protein
MEDNPLLPFTVAMTVGVSLVILLRAALSVWRQRAPTPPAHRKRPGTWDISAPSAPASPHRLSS